MPVSTVSSKGQVTLPVQVRKDDTIVIRRAPDMFELKGFLGKGLPERDERERMQKAVAALVKGGRR
jgi:bifunctional DNA-binding transcriptional regulator/antitoxin component of YhaV-PrlF toxin-antitoxin module